MMILCRTEIENEFVLDAKKMCWVAQPFLKTWSFEFHFVFEKRLRNKIGNCNNVIHIIMIKTGCELCISFTIWNSVIANLKKVISEIVLTFKSSFLMLALFLLSNVSHSTPLFLYFFDHGMNSEIFEVCCIFQLSIFNLTLNASRTLTALKMLTFWTVETYWDSAKKTLLFNCSKSKSG